MEELLKTQAEEAAQGVAQAAPEQTLPEAAERPEAPQPPKIPEAPAPEAPPAPQPPEPDGQAAALEQELEALRREKRQRQLMDEASAQLAERGIDPAFAPFVLAEDSAATRKKVEQFDRQLAAALRKHLAVRLPAGEPRDFSAARLPQRRKGIRKI